ncbi:MAG TPA: hypothetical protein VEU72_00580 [Nitrosopumilaceae archaeon]|nr:hypothetical protein [Nitrosopumilaceae archaeon]
MEDKEQIIQFGYYLQNEENYTSFKSSDIRECYQLSDIPEPSNISARMSELKRDNRLIPRGLTTYRLSKPEFDKIKELVSPEKNGRIEKVYKPGQIYDFYKDIHNITLSAKNEVFVIDAYAHEDVIELYLDKLSVGIKIMILTSKPQGNFINIAKKFKQKHGNNFKVKINDHCHDRLFFADKKCYVIGQSIEKAATDKPTYLCEIQNSGAFRSVFQNLYDTAKTLI